MHLRKLSSVILSLSLGLLSCTSSQEEVEELRYYKDHRTNLCFVHNSVTSSNGFTYDLYTYVPCTSEVEKIIEEQATKK